jgi:Ca2+/Na+ antiporter
MLKESLRVLAIVLLLTVAILDDFPFYNKMKDPTTQLFLAIVVMCMLIYDSLFGFFMGLVLMLIYYEIYKKIKITKNNNKQLQESGEADKSQSTNNIMLLDYITDEHLVSAQNNVVDKNNYNTEVKGLPNGFNNEGLYSAQGIDKKGLIMSGFDYNDKYFSLA